MDFKDLLSKGPFDPRQVMVMRHSPKEPQLRRVLPWLAADHPAVFNAFQQTQNPDAEKALMKADHVASFIGQGNKAIFVGLYRRGDWRVINSEQFWAMPAHQELKTYGAGGLEGDKTARLFDLELLDFYKDWKGRLVVQWPRGMLWWRWAHSNEFPVYAIHEHSLFDAELPPWDMLSLGWEDLKVMPTKLKSKLSEWRGIYLILDRSDGRCYVGSASGNENLLGRWQSYGITGHGGNVLLRQRDPKNFKFTILELTSPTLDKAAVIRLESSWKNRLNTREFGLNDN